MFVANAKIVIRNNIKIRSVTEQIINRVLAEHRPLISAFNAVVQALRENPDRYNIIFNSEIGIGFGSGGCGNTTSSPSLSPSYLQLIKIIIVMNILKDF